MQRCLGYFQQTVSLAAGSGRYAGFPCSAAPAAIPSPARERHSFLPTPFAAAQPRTGRQPWSAALLSSRGCSPGSPHTCLGCRETRTRWLNISYTGSARLRLQRKNAFPHLFAARPGTARAEKQEPTLCRKARHTWERQGKPAKLSQFPTSTLRNDSAPHGCKAQQVWAGPDNGDSRGTGSKSPICTDAFFIS